VDNLVEASVNLCALGLCIPPSGSESNPDDYKRVVTLVRWDRGSGSRYALQSSTVSNPGLSAGPAVTALTSVPANTNPITSGTSVLFSATTSQIPTTLSWLLDGTPKGTASGAGLGPWTFTWNLGTAGSGSEVLDGSYVVGAKAYNSYAVYGNTKALTFTLNRRIPYAPAGLAGGRNGTVVDFEWAPNKERDLQGYRVYRTSAPAGIVCTLTPDTDCQDTSPPGGLFVNYYVVAVDKDSGGSLREGDHSSSISVSSLNNRPNPPTGLSAAASGGNTTVSWNAPVIADPDLGDSIAFYRIYRDGALYSNRYDRTQTGAQHTYVDTHTGGTTHTYRVTSVDTQLAESTIVGPVTG
jgi:hypothetical protein